MSIDLPSIDEIVLLHKKYAKTEAIFELVYTHSQIVAEIAQNINIDKELGLDPEFIRVAGLVHDIGAYAFIDKDGVFDGPNYVGHGATGYGILKDAGYPEKLCRIAERHTGVGITADEVLKKHMPMPPKDYVAETDEELLIMYADKFHSKDPIFNTFEAYARFVRKFGDEKVIRFTEMADRYGIPDVYALADTYHMPVKE